MAKRISEIEGIGTKTSAALRGAGVKTVEDLLATACDRKGRALLSQKTEITESRLLKCVNMADLFRIKGVAGQYAELLESAGVDTVKELKHRNAENLVAKMNEVNTDKSLVRKTPSIRIVSSWIEQAKTMPAKISH